MPNQSALQYMQSIKICYTQVSTRSWTKQNKLLDRNCCTECLLHQLPASIITYYIQATHVRNSSCYYFYSIFLLNVKNTMVSVNHNNYNSKHQDIVTIDYTKQYFA